MTRRIQRIALTSMFAATLLILLPARSEAVPLGFECVHPDDGLGGVLCEAYEGALSAEVGDSSFISGPEVSFWFYNNPEGDASIPAITGIYFDDSLNLFGGWSLGNGSGVSFGGGSGNLPGAPIGFESTDAVDANSSGGLFGELSRVGNGIGQGEELRVTFALNAANTLENVTGALASGALKVGLFLNALPFVALGSYVNESPASTTAPEPASLLLLGSGLAGAAAYARRRRKQVN
jgi:hypothetical protein